MLIRGDLFDVLPTLADASIDACVTDPPYGIGFMGKEWDTFDPSKARANKKHAITVGVRGRQDNPNVRGRRQSPAMSPSQIEYNYSVEGLRGFQGWTEQWAREVFRVLKPGAYLVVCCAPRSYHRMACGLEDAGFVIRDKFSWLFGSGFPKNKNLGDGRGTALKPAHEPIALAWKPFKGSIAANVATHGTGALNIDACRIAAMLSDDYGRSAARADGTMNAGLNGYGEAERSGFTQEVNALGRWPANVLLGHSIDCGEDQDGDWVCVSYCPIRMLDEQTGELVSGFMPAGTERDGIGYHGGLGNTVSNNTIGDRGGASRFYYVAKPSREERDYGCDDLTPRQRDDSRKEGNPGGDNPRNRGLQPRGNCHPTVKPVELMRWLVRLVTPIGGTVLDPFTGSGTTGMACRYELREFVGIEREAEYVQIAERRIGAVAPLFSEAVS